MAKKPISIEIVQKGDESFMIRTFADGSTTRHPIVKVKRKKRNPDRPYWHWDLSKWERKGDE